MSLLSLAFLTIGLGSDEAVERPDRTPLPPRMAAVRFLPQAAERPTGALPLRGLWRVQIADPRVGGLSGLAVLPSGRLLAVTDNGALVDLPKPGSAGPAAIRDLLDGPGWPTFKKYRDSEALLLVRDRRSGREVLWVPFEFRHALYLFDRQGRSAGGRRLPPLGWSPNRGIEASTLLDDGRLLLLAENGRDVLVGRPDRLERRSLTGATGGIADAVRLPDGRILVAVREIGLGLTNRLAWLEPDGGDYRLRPWATLPLGRLHNVEGLAAEPLAGGGTRIWAVTDNDFSERRPTLLMTFDLPPRPNAQRAPARGGDARLLVPPQR
jgi:hypothetical protein